MEINVMFRAVQGWCLYSERHGKQITRATNGTWLAASGNLLHYSTQDFTYHRDDWGWWRMIYRSWAPQASDQVKCVVTCSINRPRAIANLESESKTRSCIRTSFNAPNINSGSLIARSITCTWWYNCTRKYWNIYFSLCFLSSQYFSILSPTLMMMMMKLTTRATCMGLCVMYSRFVFTIQHLE